MSSTVSLFVFLFWLSIAGSIASEPTVILSSTVTSLELGKSAKLRCQLDNFEPGNEDYWVDFCRDGHFFCSYLISAPDSSGHRMTTYGNETRYQSSLGRHPVSWTYPVYEIMVTPTIAGTKEYYCRLYGPLSVASKHLSLTVTPPPTSSAVSFP